MMLVPTTARTATAAHVTLHCHLTIVMRGEGDLVSGGCHYQHHATLQEEGEIKICRAFLLILDQNWRLNRALKRVKKFNNELSVTAFCCLDS